MEARPHSLILYAPAPGNHWNITDETAAGASILNSGVTTAHNLRSGRKNEIMRMISIRQKISKSGATAACAHSLTHVLRTPARLNRYPRISDAGGPGGGVSKVCGEVWKASLQGVPNRF